MAPMRVRAGRKRAILRLHLVKPVRQSQLLDYWLRSWPAYSCRISRSAEKPFTVAGRRGFVMLAEDHTVNQVVGKAMRSTLVLGRDAANGRIAVDPLQQSYDLILMDCQMPEMDGYEATGAIRSMEREDRPACIPYHSPYGPRHGRGQGKIPRSRHGRPPQQAFYDRSTERGIG